MASEWFPKPSFFYTLVHMLKDEIRKKSLLQRNLLSEETLRELNQQLLQQFIQLDFGSIKTIHIFLPIIKKKEPNTFLFIDWLEQNHPEIKILVSKADFSQNLMENYVYGGKHQLKINSYGIPEPDSEATVYHGEIDITIIPLLAFDQKGNRVGYGKGFYDRFLAGMNTRKIGLSFFGAIDEIKDVNLDDIRLDACITPQKLIIFKD